MRIPTFIKRQREKKTVSDPISIPSYYTPVYPFDTIPRITSSGGGVGGSIYGGAGSAVSSGLGGVVTTPYSEPGRAHTLYFRQIPDKKPYTYKLTDSQDFPYLTLYLPAEKKDGVFEEARESLKGMITTLDQRIHARLISG